MKLPIPVGDVQKRVPVKAGKSFVMLGQCKDTDIEVDPFRIRRS